ncbi:MAG: cytidine deaminase [Opitutus sp.]|nr:cytidine deaminase [Opitutus sp.]
MFELNHAASIAGTGASPRPIFGQGNRRRIDPPRARAFTRRTMKSSSSRSAAWKAQIARLPRAARAPIDALWDTGGVVPAAISAEMMRTLRLDLPGWMMMLVPVAQHYAIVPVSAYQVGVVVAGELGAGDAPTLYFGANIEFSGIALNFTLHAEQCAVNNAWLNGERGLSALAVSAAPCGHCRQFLNELATGGELPIFMPAAKSGAWRSNPLGDLLPQAFGPSALGVRGGLMDPPQGAPTLTIKRGAARDHVVAMALDAARASYAPYPTPDAGQFSGVALEFSDGAVVTGRYAGNAAYNPSLSPLQSALAFAHLNRSGAASRTLRRCVLVEVPTLASQEIATAALLAVVAPKVKLEYFAARLG